MQGGVSVNKLVFDIGGTFVKYALMDMEAKIYEQGKVKTPLDSLDSLLNVIESIYKTYEGNIDGLAFSMPGNIDVDTGQIYTPGRLKYNANINFIDALHSRINLPVAIENDGKSAALAEVWKGNLSDCQDGAVLILGTGIGGGFVHNRKLLKGKHFFSGEVSFLLTDSQHIAKETMFAWNGSTTALIFQVCAKKGLDIKDVDGKKIFNWILEGDEECKEILSSVCHQIAVQIYNIQCFLDPERICIGGGISKQPLLIETIKKKLDELYKTIPFDFPHVEIAPCRFYNDSNLIGALYNYKLHFNNK